MNVLQLLASRNYIAVNKDLIRIIGLEETIVLGELASEYNYFLNRDELYNGYFYSTIENIEENTSLSEYKQRKVFTKLQDMEIINIDLKGMPAKRYIKINEEQIIKLLDLQFLKNYRTSSLKTKEQVPKKLKVNNNIINNNIKENNNNKLLLQKKVFKKPSIEEVKKYCSERQNGIDAEYFIDFYESKGWLVGKSKMKDWKACVRTWEKNRKKNQDVNLPNWFDKENEKEVIDDETRRLIAEIEGTSTNNN